MVTWNGQGLEAYILELSGKDKAIILVYTQVMSSIQFTFSVYVLKLYELVWYKKCYLSYTT